MGRKWGARSAEWSERRQLMAVRPTGLAEGFVELVLASLRSHLRAAQVGIAIPGISRSDVLEVPLVLPPVDQQVELVTVVDELLAGCESLRQAIVGKNEAAANLDVRLVTYSCIVGCFRHTPQAVAGVAFSLRL